MRIDANVLVTPNRPLSRESMEIEMRSDDEVIVEVVACGLCHTDLGFWNGSVVPKRRLPIVLGHEIVGRVVAARGANERALGHRVLVPAVMSCGDCAFCRAGRGNACPRQQMPGNDIDGGFATHLVVPARSLVRIDDVPPHIDWRELSVVADAVSTAHRAVTRAAVGKGDLAFVVGAGGVGGYAIQIAAAFGARVVAFDVSRERLTAMQRFGAERVIDVKDRAPKDVRKEAQDIARELGIPSIAHRIFECSGTPEGQQLAFALIGPASTMMQVGYSSKPLELRLSNLMAFDATVHGTWGCPQEAYPEVLRLVFEGKVQISPFVEHMPMSRIDAVLDDMAHHRLAKRVVFDPRA